ncbi:hypothetical protein BVIET440_150043 [Burkholderia vietnamiensis]
MGVKKAFTLGIRRDARLYECKYRPAVKTFRPLGQRFASWNACKLASKQWNRFGQSTGIPREIQRSKRRFVALGARCDIAYLCSRSLGFLGCDDRRHEGRCEPPILRTH